MNKTIPILSKNDVPSSFKWIFDQRSMSFDKDLKLDKKYCHHPFNTATIDDTGDVYICICEAWLPISVGKIWEFNTLDEILNTHKARVIQDSILDGSYRYCDESSCSLIKQNTLDSFIPEKTINWLNFTIDESCNLTCPSCRNEFKFIKESSPKYNFKMSLVNKIIELLDKHKSPIKFTLSGDGDPFASLIYRNFLTLLDLTDKSNVEIELVTNGILIKDHWDLLNKIHKNIVRTKISVDAGSEEIYRITRRGGSWNKMIESLQYLVNWRNVNATNMKITTNFVVQQTNYLDMKNYVKLCVDLGIDEINFQKIQDWGTFKNFKDQAVWSHDHHNYLDFKRNLEDPIFTHPKINFTNLSNVRT